MILRRHDQQSALVGPTSGHDDSHLVQETYLSWTYPGSMAIITYFLSVIYPNLKSIHQYSF